VRTAFINKLMEIAEKDKDVYLLTGDLGFSVFEKFAEKFPDRFYNVGIAEQSMIGIAAGLALNGKKVYCYSIIPFVTMRCFEQIRIDLCYQNLNVNLVGVGGGVSYSPAGATHHAIEDVALMRALPNMKVICPGDPFETENAVEQVANIEGPTYIRLNRNHEPRLYNEANVKFELGKAIKITEGNDISIISMGNMLEESIRLTNRLIESGYKVKLLSMHTVKPIDKAAIYECINDTKCIYTIEEHNVIGGLGSAAAEVIAASGKGVKFRSFGIPDVYADCAGDREFFRKKYGIDEKSVFNKIVNDIKE